MIGFFICKYIDYKQFNFVRASNAFAHYTSCFLALVLFLLFNEFLTLAFEKVRDFTSQPAAKAGSLDFVQFRAPDQVCC